MAADTSSAPAASSPVVGASAALLAAASAEPMPSKSAAAATNTSCAAIRYSIAGPLAARLTNGSARSVSRCLTVHCVFAWIPAPTVWIGPSTLKPVPTASVAVTIGSDTSV